MGKAFAQFFAAFTQLFAALEKAASAINHLSTWADETAASFEDESRMDRIAKRKAMEAAAGITIDGNPIEKVKAIKAA